MSTTTASAATTGAAATPSTRDRILEAATELFYANGIRAVSADKIIERVGITKVTFYRHFRTKDDLVVAYLERQAARERGALEGVRASAGTDAEAFRSFAELIGTASCQPGFRGCAFINAAAEYADPGSAVRAIVADHRAWYRETFAEMLGSMGVTDVEDAADEVLMLRDGAMVAGYLSEAPRVGRALGAAIAAVASAHGAPSAR
ncbi:TetR/AcrR family transcriptional regulator [Luteimicrobium sp. DT211]|uniref:TetR/AcrR family transcriptional regulator n=1 Tax=Luteimicrobium sp. DT211 TaxID=3393412 RepID=UPI003CF9C42F